MKLLTMKLLTKSAVALATFSLATIAFAADPLHNTTWQTIDDEDNTPKALVKITEVNGKLTAKVIKGYTAKAKKHVGTTVIKNLKADGGGKYSGGTITDPSKNKSYKLTVTRNGNVMKLKGHLGPFYRTQTWKKK